MGVIGQNRAGSDECAVLNYGRLIEKSVVLYFDIIADPYAGPDVSTASHDASSPENGVLSDLREVPDDRVRTDDCARVHVGGFNYPT
jgi:hypothetical protein